MFEAEVIHHVCTSRQGWPRFDPGILRKRRESASPGAALRTDTWRRTTTVRDPASAGTQLGGNVPAAAVWSRDDGHAVEPFGVEGACTSALDRIASARE